MRLAHYRSPLLVAVMATFAISAAGADDIGAPDVSAARSICRNVMHIPEGFLPYLDCVDSLSHSASLQRNGSAQAAYLSSSFPGSGKSYATSTAEERRAKEERSCQRVGQSPGTVGFINCVTNLDTALQSTERSE